MNKTKFLISLVLAVSVLIGQVGGVLAAPASQEPAPITGKVHSITLETDPNTGITTVIIEITGTNQAKRTVRISQETAVTIGLVVLDGDGNPEINNLALGQPVEIDPAAVIPDQQEERHPVGNALSTFFSDIADYEAIMAAHDKGVSFSVIAQALWLTRKVKGDSSIFNALLLAKQNNDYTDLPFDILDENGAPITPKNWAQLRKAILDDKKVDKPDNAASNQNTGNNKNKDKNKDKGNNGKGDDKDRNKNK